MTDISPFSQLGKVTRQDSEYAWTLHCSLAMPIMDELHCTHEQANRAAARIMRLWFDVDITKHVHWQYPAETEAK